MAQSHRRTGPRRAGRLHRSFSQRRRAELIDAFDLDPRKKCRTYSKGNRQKVAIISALASDAQLLLLDEPTAGLDPLMEVVFQQALADLRQDGRTVLLSSHILAQVEKLADTVSIIRRGSVVQSGSLAQLRQLNRTHVDAHTVRPATGLAQLAGVHDLQQEDTHLRFTVEAGQLDSVLGHLTGFGFTALSCHPPTLEELMLSHYGDELAAHSGHEHRAQLNGAGS